MLVRNKFPTIDAVHLAKYVLVTQGAMSHLKLQKILFYIEAWHLVFNDSALIPEDFKAWVHGPVLLSVWHEAKKFSTLNGEISIKKESGNSIISKVESNLTKDQIALIKDVLKEYGTKPAHHLESLTHAELPWIEARGELAPHEPSKSKIKKSTMKMFYRTKLR